LTIQNIQHSYHEGWDCICSVEPLPSGRFRPVVHCRSLLDGKTGSVPAASHSHERHAQALAHARQLAVTWARDHKHPTGEDRNDE
jgi:hypothetical protein